MAQAFKEWKQRQAIIAHTEDRVFDIDDNFDELELRVSKLQPPGSATFGIAIEFWAS